MSQCNQNMHIRRSKVEKYSQYNTKVCNASGSSTQPSLRICNPQANMFGWILSMSNIDMSSTHQNKHYKNMKSKHMHTCTHTHKTTSQISMHWQSFGGKWTLGRYAHGTINSFGRIIFNPLSLMRNISVAIWLFVYTKVEPITKLSGIHALPYGCL